MHLQCHGSLADGKPCVTDFFLALQSVGLSRSGVYHPKMALLNMMIHHGILGQPTCNTKPILRYLGHVGA